MNVSRASLLVLLVLGMSVNMSYAELMLSFNRSIFVPDLERINGLAFDGQTNHLWMAGVGEDRSVSEAAIVEWDIEIDQEVSWIDPGGIVEVPLSVAVHPTTGNVFLFGFNEVGEPGDDDPTAVFAGGEFTQTGTPVRSFDNGEIILGTGFDMSGELIGIANSDLIQINQTTGSIDSVLVSNVPGGGSGAVAVDPITGNIFVYEPNGPDEINDVLMEFDSTTGNLLSTTEVPRAFLGNGFRGRGFAFNETGSQIYIGANSVSSERQNLVVLDRFVIPEPASLWLLICGALIVALRAQSDRQ